MTKTNQKIWFITGSFPQLSAAEIAAVLNLSKKNYYFREPILIADIEMTAPEDLITRLGGSVKIARQIGEIEEEELTSFLAKILEEKKGKIVFGINFYSDDPVRQNAIRVEKWEKNVKMILRQKGLNARYIYKNEPTLSSAVVKHNDLLKKGAEFIILREKKKFVIAQTIAVQPFEDWGERDFGRPARDNLSGMLPPKVARIMINLAAVEPKKETLLDPFCGSGTIIAEAALMGFKKIIGSDISAKAIADTESNLKWLNKRQPIKLESVELKQFDVSELSKRVAKVDVIITEPYLGPPRKGNEPQLVLNKQIHELTKLYSLALHEFTKILNPQGIIIMIIPRFRSRSGWLTIDIADEIKKIGLVAEPFSKIENRENVFLLYARENQLVGREIWRFKKYSS